MAGIGLGRSSLSGLGGGSSGGGALGALRGFFLGGLGGGPFDLPANSEGIRKSQVAFC